MRYTYKDDHGCEVDFDFPMGEAPSEFQDEEQGYTWRRVYTANAVHLKGSGWASKS